MWIGIDMETNVAEMNGDAMEVLGWVEKELKLDEKMEWTVIEYAGTGDDRCN